ncbi:MAG: 1-deoxy-D-xylulose-5-phosphate reductoisomerase, partial [Lachnospirales bacterium]
KINKILLTASGGPFRTYDDLSNVTIDDALKHPNWSMGKKITVDSATLMNKGLEVIEAKWLFDVDLEQIEVLVHPQSIIHSMVEYEDGAVIAQLGIPDMKVPIQYALTYPKRVRNSFPKINFFEKNNLTFEKPRMDMFPCLGLAYDAIKTGGTMPTVMNASNEIAVAKFINKEIGFLDIPKLIEKAMSAYNVIYNYTLDDVLEADKWAREYTRKL